MIPKSPKAVAALIVERPGLESRHQRANRSRGGRHDVSIRFVQSSPAADGDGVTDLTGLIHHDDAGARNPRRAPKELGDQDRTTPSRGIHLAVRGHTRYCAVPRDGRALAIASWQ